MAEKLKPDQASHHCTLAIRSRVAHRVLTLSSVRPQLPPLQGLRDLFLASKEWQKLIEVGCHAFLSGLPRSRTLTSLPFSSSSPNRRTPVASFADVSAAARPARRGQEGKAEGAAERHCHRARAAQAARAGERSPGKDRGGMPVRSASRPPSVAAFSGSGECKLIPMDAWFEQRRTRWRC